MKISYKAITGIVGIAFVGIVAVVGLNCTSFGNATEIADENFNRLLQKQETEAQPKNYVNVDNEWDLYDEITLGGEPISRLIGVAVQSAKIYSEDNLPYCMAVVEVGDGSYEWYYNYNEFNTLKCILRNKSVVVEMYYHNENKTDVNYEFVSSRSDDFRTSLASALDCKDSEVVVSETDYNSYTFSVENVSVETGVSEDGLLYFKCRIDSKN